MRTWAARRHCDSDITTLAVTRMSRCRCGCRWQLGCSLRQGRIAGGCRETRSRLRPAPAPLAATQLARVLGSESLGWRRRLAGAAGGSDRGLATGPGGARRTVTVARALADSDIAMGSVSQSGCARRGAQPANRARGRAGRLGRHDPSYSESLRVCAARSRRIGPGAGPTQMAAVLLPSGRAATVRARPSSLSIAVPESPAGGPRRRAAIMIRPSGAHLGNCPGRAVLAAANPPARDSDRDY
jgi:hypothetical protein